MLNKQKRLKQTKIFSFVLIASVFIFSQVLLAKGKKDGKFEKNYQQVM